jgi:hypothetical protein
VGAIQGASLRDIGRSLAAFISNAKPDLSLHAGLFSFSATARNIVLAPCGGAARKHRAHPSRDGSVAASQPAITGSSLVHSFCNDPARDCRRSALPATT